MSDIEKIVTAIQGNPVKRETLGSDQDGQVLTWSGTDNQWKSKISSSSSAFLNLKYSVKTINSNYTIDPDTDSVIYVYTDAGAFTVTLPSVHNDGDAYIVKDWAGNATENNITVNTTDGSAINGVYSVAITNAYEGYTFVRKEGKWNTDTNLSIFSSDSVQYSPITQAHFPPNPSSDNLTLKFNTSAQGTITVGSGYPFISLANDTSKGIILNTDIPGGNNCPITLKSGAGPGSTSIGAHNIHLDSGSENGTAHASIYLTTGYGGSDNGQEITIDSKNASVDPSVAQMSFTPQKIRLNSSGLCFSQIAEVSGEYGVNGTDYILAADTTEAAVTVTLPTGPARGDTYVVKDGSGNASVNNVTLDGGTISIDGATALVLSTNFAKATVTFDGTKWLVL